MKALRTKLVGLCETMGCPTAAKWNKPKTVSRLKDLLEQVGDGMDMDEPEQTELLRRLVEEFKAGRLDGLQIVDDVNKPEVTEAFVAEHGGPVATDGEVGAAEAATEVEEVAEEKPAKAPKAKKEKKAPAADAEPASEESDLEPVKPAKVKKAPKSKSTRVSPLDSVLAAIRDLKQPATKAELADAAAKIHTAAGGDKDQVAKLSAYLRQALVAAEAFGVVVVSGSKVTPVGK